MLVAAHAGQDAAIRDALDHSPDFRFLCAEDFFHIERDVNERAASACVLDDGFESLFLGHGISIIKRRTCESAP